MVARFPNMIAIMFNTIKTGQKTCEVPVNKLCISTLRLFREHNLIYGFQYISPGIQHHRLYPRIRIYFKYSDVNGSCITYLRPLKNTKSNFHVISPKFLKQENNHKKFIITTPKGLNFLSFFDLYNSKNRKAKRGKKILEISY